jgi:phosphopantothenate synthetase
MAVTTQRRDKDKLLLEFDNGDLEKFDQVLKEWNFKDEQSLLRFAVSIMLTTEKQIIYVNKNEAPAAVVPSAMLLKASKG